jgi:hypothetical protein
MEKLVNVGVALVTINVVVVVAARKFGEDAAWLTVIVELPVTP